MFHFLLHITGGDNGSGAWYLEWSGFISLLFMLGFIIKWFENSRCHVGGHGFRGCRRHGRYPFKHYKLCHKHHPAVPAKLTHHHILKLHKADQDPYER